MASPKTKDKQSLLNSLSPRERQLLGLLCAGCTLDDSAKRMGVAYSTANTHVNAIYKKLKVNSRATLIIEYAGLI